MCLTGAVVTSWPLTQEVAHLSPFTVMTNISVTEFAEFSETFRKNSITLQILRQGSRTKGVKISKYKTFEFYYLRIVSVPILTSIR